MPGVRACLIVPSFVLRGFLVRDPYFSQQFLCFSPEIVQINNKPIIKKAILETCNREPLTPLILLLKQVGF